MPRSLSDLFERGTPVGAWWLVAPLDKNLAAPLWVAHAGGRVAYLRSFRVRSLRTAERLKQVMAWAAAYEHNSLLPHIDLLELEGGGGYAVVSRYEEGHLLAPMLAKANLARKPVPPPVAAQIAIDLLEALVATGGRLAPAWAQGALRPESVLITRGGRARLMELGAAGVMAGVDPLARDVRWAAYASPEQTETGKPGPNSDVFTLAALLWEMLVNRPAFEGRNYGELKPKLLDAEVERADQRARKRVPTALADVIAQGLAREPEERFETPKAFATAIRAASGAVAERVEVADYLEQLHQAAMNVRRRNLEQALGRPAPTSIPPAPREAPRVAASALAPKAPKVPQLDKPPSSVAPPPASTRPPPSNRPPSSARPVELRRPALAPPAEPAPRLAAERPPKSAPTPESAPPPRANVLPPDPVPLTKRADDPPPADADHGTEAQPAAPSPAEPAERDEPAPPTASEDDLDWGGADEAASLPEASAGEDQQPASPSDAATEAGQAADAAASDEGVPSAADSIDVDGAESAPAAAPSVEVALDLDDDPPSDEDDAPGDEDDAPGDEGGPGDGEDATAPAADASAAEEPSQPAATPAPQSSPVAASPAAFDPEALLAEAGLDDLAMRPPRRWPAVVVGMVIGSVVTLAAVYGTGGPTQDSCPDGGNADAGIALPPPAPSPTPPPESAEPEPAPSVTASASASAKKKKGRPARPRPRPKPAATAKPTAAPPPPPPPPPATEGSDIYD